MKMFTRKGKSNKGFSLAELLVVIAIMGILAAITVPILVSKINKANVATDNANGDAAKSAFTAIVAGNDGKIVTNDAGAVISAITSTGTTATTGTALEDAVRYQVVNNELGFASTSKYLTKQNGYHFWLKLDKPYDIVIDTATTKAGYTQLDK